MDDSVKQLLGEVTRMSQLVGEQAATAHQSMAQLTADVRVVNQGLEECKRNLIEVQSKSRQFCKMYEEHQECWKGPGNPKAMAGKIDNMEESLDGVDDKIKDRFGFFVKIFGAIQAIYLFLFGFMLYKLFDLARLIE